MAKLMPLVPVPIYSSHPSTLKGSFYQPRPPAWVRVKPLVSLATIHGQGAMSLPKTCSMNF